MDNIRFLDGSGTFTLDNPENVSGLYFPLAGEAGLKSAIAPGLGGDCKLDQESFLLEPVSIEDLHNRRSTRNFWCVTEEGCWSAAGASAQQEADRFTPEQDESALTAGLMWQKVSRESKRFGLRSEITSFVPVRENVEVMEVRITNAGSAPKKLTCVGAVPIYGRSADNIRDHRNVTSMLHRTRTTERGVRHQRHHHRGRRGEFHRRPQRHRPGVDGPRPLAADDHQALYRPDRRPGHPPGSRPLLQGPPGHAGHPDGPALE